MRKAFMYRFKDKTIGVTLLEIMLVLAVAAMIIVMSVRYYQSASSNQQANAAVQQITAIMAAVESLGGAGYTKVNQTLLTQAMGGASAMKTPTGGTITFTPQSDTGYALTVPLNTAICDMVAAKFKANTKITPTCSSGSGSLDFVYDATKS